MSWQGWISTASSTPALLAAPRLPTRQEEDWKYVSLKWLESWNFKPALKASVDVLPLSDDFDEIIVADGFLHSEIPAGYQVEVIRHDEKPSDQFQSWFNEIQNLKERVGAAKDLFEDLNHVRFQEGLFLDIKANTSATKPLVIRWVNTSAPGTRYPRLWVRVGSRAKLVLAEVFESSSNVEALAIPVADVEVGESAKLEFSRVVRGSLDNAQVGRTRFFQKANSTLESLSVAFGARLVRHNLDVYLCEEGANSRLQGLAFTGGAQVVDHHTRVDHVVGNCLTTQLYKAVLAGSSRAVFNGQVVIRHNAQKANSDQLNQNLLLSSQAEVDSKPQLEIWADDVKATHGSTIGQMNEEEVFYFLSRAIPRPQAESMIRRGFTQDLLLQVSHPQVRNWLLTLQNEADQRLLV